MLQYRTNIGSALTNMELLEAEQKFRERNMSLINYFEQLQNRYRKWYKGNRINRTHAIVSNILRDATL